MKKFLSVDGKTVSYQVWGDAGPLVLALHGSPQSARAVTHVGEVIAAHGYQVIAPDTPGNGKSDPLLSSEHTTMVDYAKALHRFVETLGISNHGIYGFHTGAAIACTYGALYPQNTNSIFFDGLPNWSSDEQESLIGYLESFQPRWDGSHMTWLWARMEEQTVFFPWHRNNSAHRMDYNVAPAEACHANVMDLLNCKNNYIQPYSEALNFNPANWIKRIQAPNICAANNEDVLKEHLSRPGFEDISPYVYATREQMYAKALSLFDENKGESTVLKEPNSRPCGFVTFSTQQIFWQGQHDPKIKRPTVVFLHGSGDSHKVYARLAKSLGIYANTISFDLPGHGYSDDCSSLESFSIEHLAHHYHQACMTLGLGNYVVVGQRLGAIIANEMHRLNYTQEVVCVDRQDSLNKDDWHLFKQMNCSLEPQWDGAHLVRAWRIARWETLFHPWFRRDKQHASQIVGAQLEPAHIQSRAEALLMAKQEWIKALTLESSLSTATALRHDNNEYTTRSASPNEDKQGRSISQLIDNWFDVIMQKIKVS